jgi:hypothetical protein
MNTIGHNTNAQHIDFGAANSKELDAFQTLIDEWLNRPTPNAPEPQPPKGERPTTKHYSMPARAHYGPRSKFESREASSCRTLVRADGVKISLRVGTQYRGYDVRIRITPAEIFQLAGEVAHAMAEAKGNNP